MYECHFGEDLLLGQLPPILIDSAMKYLSCESSPYIIGTIYQGKSHLADIFLMHQGVLNEKTSNDDDPYIPLMWLNLHILNIEPNTRNGDLSVS